MDKPVTLKSKRAIHIKYNLPISKTSKFWEGLKDGKIYATKCKKCRRLHFPPMVDCGNCGSSNAKWVELDGEGKIETFTQVVVKPPSFSDESSYIVAIATLKEGIKALAWLIGIERERVKVGMKVRLVTNVASDGRAIYAFVPI